MVDCALYTLIIGTDFSGGAIWIVFTAIKNNIMLTCAVYTCIRAAHTQIALSVGGALRIGHTGVVYTHLVSRTFRIVRAAIRQRIVNTPPLFARICAAYT